MLFPKKVKHRKWHKGRRRGLGVASTKISVDYGVFALRVTEHAWITSRQIEAARRAMTRYMKRGGKLWIRIFPDKPVTKKGLGMPMGGGKGAVDHYVAPVKPGTIIFEIDGVDVAIAREAMRLASHKLPVKSVFVTKN